MDSEVSVPASSANLGPGFDVLGMALDVRATLATAGDAEDGVVEATHPGAAAFARLGGRGAIRVHSPIPVGRGLGYSGAMRVGGLALALVQQGADIAEVCTAEVLRLAADLDGHGDNVAASLFGGVVVTSGDCVVRVPLTMDPAVVVWVPTTETSTPRSRRTLPDTVTRADAVFNVGRASLLVAAFAAGRRDVLRTATEDRLHQDVRLAAKPEAAEALRAGLDAGAWCGWLSGSGPSVAFLVDQEGAGALATALPPGGRALVTAIDDAGTTITRHR